MTTGRTSLLETELPALPLEAWRPTKETLHRFAQIVGKVRLEHSPYRNHWWHVPLYVSPRGLAARHMFSGDLPFEVSFDLISHELEVLTGAGDRVAFALEDGLSVASFYRKLLAAFEYLGVDVDLNNPTPFDLGDDRHFGADTEHASYDKEYVERYRRVLAWVDLVFREFSARFNGKTSPVQLYWHSFDLAVTRFSGRRAPLPEDADLLTREGYSHEVISFGFWPGDANVQEPAFYSYTAPAPQDLTEQPLRPASASWQGGSAMLPYEVVRGNESPKDTLLEFLESAYQAGAKTADWDVEDLKAVPASAADR
jgi:Family of unknown function (DUF5996)